MSTSIVGQSTQDWLISIFHSPGNCDWLKDGVWYKLVQSELILGFLEQLRKMCTEDTGHQLGETDTHLATMKGKSTIIGKKRGGGHETNSWWQNLSPWIHPSLKLPTIFFNIMQPKCSIFCLSHCELDFYHLQQQQKGMKIFKNLLNSWVSKNGNGFALNLACVLESSLWPEEQIGSWPGLEVGWWYNVLYEAE